MNVLVALTIVDSTTAVPFRSTSLFAAEAGSVDEVSSMRVGEIKKELESYGISTKSFLEKSELVDALVDARAKGLTPKESSSSSSTSSTTSSSSASSTESTTSDSTDSRPREERLAEEMEKLKGMKAGEMKKELEGLGISTKSFFEKSEFQKALAEARVDGVTAKKGGGSSNNNNKSCKKGGPAFTINDPIKIDGLSFDVTNATFSLQKGEEDIYCVDGDLALIFGDDNND